MKGIPMKEKMTIPLVGILFIGIVYFGSSSNESVKSETIVSEAITPFSIEGESIDFINDDTSETATFNEVKLEVDFSSMNTCVLKKMDTDLLPFSEAFGYFRQCLGSERSFKWKGLEYTTLLSEEVIIQIVDSVQVEENSMDTEISQLR